MDYQQAVGWLYSTQSRGIKLGLDNVHRLLDTIGFRNEQRFVHVAGTNGKGSVCAMIDAICRAQGLRTGLFTSPHLVSFRERVRVNGTMIPESAAANWLTRLRDLVSEWETHPTFFELTTALALGFFQRAEVDVVVLETGLGGRLDATNAVRPVVSVITPVSLDHEAWLGSTLAEIAAEKAGIIKAGVPVVSAAQQGQAAAVLRETAAGRGAPLMFVEEPLTGIAIGLAGSYQAWNAALAVQALRSGRIEVSEAAIERGLREVSWPGRFQLVGDRFVLDGAHNPSAAECLVQTWREKFGGEEATVILGVLEDKDAAGICKALLPIARHVIATGVKSPRARDAREIAAIVHGMDPQIACSAVGELSDAIRSTSGGERRVLVTGSLFLIGEALSLLGAAEPSYEWSSQ